LGFVVYLGTWKEQLPSKAERRGCGTIYEDWDAFKLIFSL
jgi:hypothetical protein